MKTNIQNLFVALALLAVSTSAHADTVYVANNGSNNIMQFTLGGGSSVFANANTPHPWCVAFDSEGNLYSGSPDTRVEKFSPTGTYLGIFANSGATGLAFDSAGNLYVANGAGNNIRKFSSTGTDLGVFASSGLFYPIGLAFDSAGNLYVANGNGNNIRKFSSTGTDLGVFASSGGQSPYGLAFDRTGNLYVANNGPGGGIVKITTNGVGSSFANIGATPVGLAFDGEGNLYASYNQINTIGKFSSTGTDLGVFATNGLNNPMQIAIKIDALPTLRVVPSGNQSVLVWPASGTNYTLQSTTNLTSTNWVAATDAVPVIAFTVTNTSPARFFRLVKP